MNKNIKKISIISMILTAPINLHQIHSMDHNERTRQEINFSQNKIIQSSLPYILDEDIYIENLTNKPIDYSQVLFFPCFQVEVNPEIENLFHINVMKNSNPYRYPY